MEPPACNCRQHDNSNSSYYYTSPLYYTKSCWEISSRTWSRYYETWFLVKSCFQMLFISIFIWFNWNLYHLIIWLNKKIKYIFETGVKFFFRSWLSSKQLRKSSCTCNNCYALTFYVCVITGIQRHLVDRNRCGRSATWF